MSRRQFLAQGCMACAGATGILAATRPGWADPNAEKVHIRIIYALHADRQPVPDWPNLGFDFVPVMRGIHDGLKRRCPGFEFVTSTATGPEQAQKILESDRSAGIDGYLVCQMNCWNDVVRTVLASGKPTLYADFQYGGSGGFLISTAAMLRARTRNFGFVASSEIDDLAESVKCFRVVKGGGSASAFAAATARARIARTAAPGDRTCNPDDLKTLAPQECLKRAKASKIVAVGGDWPGIAPVIEKEMGISVCDVPFAVLNDAWKAADKDRCREIVERWEATAEEISEVSRETLEACAAMYLALKAVLEKLDANAITINCLEGFSGGHIQAYPCLGFHELLNEGVVGACESDLRSAATMVMMTALTQGRPGYISDAVIDTTRRQIIYAHCVASNRAFGPRGAANPFSILTHSEDRQGASVRSTLPLGYMTTTVEFAPEGREILFHHGKTVENVIDDRACRTKLAVEPVGNIEKLFTEWDRWWWHRVTYYGDLEAELHALADALGWKVTPEA